VRMSCCLAHAGASVVPHVDEYLASDAALDRVVSVRDVVKSEAVRWEQRQRSRLCCRGDVADGGDQRPGRHSVDEHEPDGAVQVHQVEHWNRWWGCLRRIANVGSVIGDNRTIEVEVGRQRHLDLSTLVALWMRADGRPPRGLASCFGSGYRAPNADPRDGSISREAGRPFRARRDPAKAPLWDGLVEAGGAVLDLVGVGTGEGEDVRQSPDAPGAAPGAVWDFVDDYPYPEAVVGGGAMAVLFGL
jgi:hypothetical protein